MFTHHRHGDDGLDRFISSVPFRPTAFIRLCLLVDVFACVRACVCVCVCALNCIVLNCCHYGVIKHNNNITASTIASFYHLHL